MSHAENNIQSQNPTPSKWELSRPKQKKPTPSKTEPTQDQRGTEKVPFVIKSVPTEKTADQAEEDRKDRDIKTSLERRVVTATEWQAILAAIMVGIGSLQLGLFVWQLRLIRDSLTDTKKSADAAFLTAESVIVSERAYIRIGHMPSGATLDRPLADHLYEQDKPYIFEAKIRVGNLGKTPGTVSSVWLGHTMIDTPGSFPVRPLYKEGDFRPAGAILYGTDNLSGYSLRIEIDPASAASIFKGTKQLCLLGYVDYIDHFRKRYRGGYASLFNPKTSEGNLLIIPQAGYNYDRPRKEDEGDDWDKPI